MFRIPKKLCLFAHALIHALIHQTFAEDFTTCRAGMTKVQA